MPLASYQGKLFVKDGKLCTSCCDGYEPYGCCCYLDSDGTWQKEQMTAFDCTGMMESSFSSETDCDDVECPPPEPPITGVCLYRDDELGSCWGYGLTQDIYTFDTEAEAQAWITAGNCEKDPDAPDCAVCSCYIEPEYEAGKWSVIKECVVFEPEYDAVGNETGNYICKKTIYLSSCTIDQCDPQAYPLADIEWRNDKPATHCRFVDSEDECTESTGVFCPGLTECPDDLSAGCPETPIRSNPLP